MEQENKHLKEHITFLEALINVNTESLQKALDTNRKLIDYLKDKGTI